MKHKSLFVVDAPTMSELGARLARCCCSETIIYLQGELGAGKTTLARGFLRAYGYDGTVKSPTYTLVEPYQLRGLQLYHIDLYRLAQPNELDSLGLSDYLTSDAILLIEWPEKAEQLLPKANLRCMIKLLPRGREVQLMGQDAKGLKLLNDLSR